MEKVYLGKSKLLFSFLDIYNSKVKTKHLMEMSSRTKVFFLLLQSPVLAIYKLNHITIYFRFLSSSVSISGSVCLCVQKFKKMDTD